MILIIDQDLVYSCVNPVDITDDEIDDVVEMYSDIESLLKLYNIQSSVEFGGNGVTVRIFGQKICLTEDQMSILIDKVINALFNFELDYIPHEDELKFHLKTV